MSSWNAKTGEIVNRPPEPYPNYPGWELIDCGCCVGLQWGGEEPRECETCQGGGFIARHKKSGMLAMYPGGPITA